LARAPLQALALGEFTALFQTPRWIQLHSRGFTFKKREGRSGEERKGVKRGGKKGNDKREKGRGRETMSLPIYM